MASIVTSRKRAASRVPDDTEPRSSHAESRKDGSLASQVPSLRGRVFLKKYSFAREASSGQEPTAKVELSPHGNPNVPMPNVAIPYIKPSQGSLAKNSTTVEPESERLDTISILKELPPNISAYSSSWAITSGATSLPAPSATRPAQTNVNYRSGSRQSRPSESGFGGFSGFDDHVCRNILTSKHSALYIEADYQVYWELPSFLSRFFPEGQLLGNILTVTGDTHRVYATTAHNYVTKTFPNIGRTLLEGLEQFLRYRKPGDSLEFNHYSCAVNKPSENPKWPKLYNSNRTIPYCRAFSRPQESCRRTPDSPNLHLNGISLI